MGNYQRDLSIITAGPAVGLGNVLQDFGSLQLAITCEFNGLVHTAGKRRDLDFSSNHYSRETMAGYF